MSLDSFLVRDRGPARPDGRNGGTPGHALCRAMLCAIACAYVTCASARVDRTSHNGQYVKSQHIDCARYSIESTPVCTGCGMGWQSGASQARALRALCQVVCVAWTLSYESGR